MLSIAISRRRLRPRGAAVVAPGFPNCFERGSGRRGRPPCFHHIWLTGLISIGAVFVFPESGTSLRRRSVDGAKPARRPMNRLARILPVAVAACVLAWLWYSAWPELFRAGMPSITVDEFAVGPSHGLRRPPRIAFYFGIRNLTK
jgi:hypothetical protein